MSEWLPVLVSALLAYLAGSIPFGLILAKAKGHGDIRAIGSGNIGATNVLRTGDKTLAAATLACDVAKGFIPVLIAQGFGPETAAAAALAAPLGHVFPVWLGFRGGKAVATGWGALLAYVWPVALAAMAVWLVVALVSRYSALAAAAAAAAAPVCAWLFGETNAKTLVALLLALLVIWRHGGNIGRLLRGEEGKIDLGKQ